MGRQGVGKTLFDLVVWERTYVGNAVSSNITYFPQPVWSSSQDGEYGNDGRVLGKFKNFGEAFKIKKKLIESLKLERPVAVKLPDGTHFTPHKGSFINLGIVFNDKDWIIG